MRAQKKILIIDDEPDNVTIMRYILEYHRFDVITANDGQKGIKEAITNLPDLIILDMNMPVMDGLTACREIKKNPMIASIPVIIMTASISAKDQKDTLSSGANAFMVKPVEDNLLLFKINGFFGEGTIKKRISQNIVKWEDYQKKVMVVEDDHVSRKIVVNIVENLGYTAYQSSNGKRALDSLFDNPNMDLMIADLIMPEMGGKELIRIIRKEPRFAKMPIILISAILKKEDVEDILVLGDMAFFEKPIKGMEIRDCILDYFS